MDVSLRDSLGGGCLQGQKRDASLLSGTPCDDDGDPCTQDYCVQGQCIHPCDDCRWPDFGVVCFDGVPGPAYGQARISTDSPDRICPGETIQVDVIASCSPDCGLIAIDIQDPSQGNAWGSAAITCDGVDHTTTVNVYANEDAPMGATLRLREVWSPGGAAPDVNVSGSITVAEHVNLRFADTSDEDESYPGGFLVLNDDDDNGNGVPDMDDPGGTDPDDRSLTLSDDGTLSGDVELRFLSGSDKVKVYANANRTGLTTLPHTWAVSSLPETIYLEGVVVSLSHADITLELRHTGAPGAACKDRVDLTVYHVKDVTWETVTNSGNLPVDNDTINNGGKRVFPGKLSPGDNPAPRRAVNLVATVEPTIPELEGRMVYFKVWDVDDPFDQLNAGMPDVNLIDGDNAGPDNRGTEPLVLPWTASQAVDATGRARVTFTLSMQPGNNYRAAASALDNATSQADQTTADAINNEQPATPGSFAGYKVPVTWSQMLTVWRKLHVETDTMVRPTFAQNTFTMNWDEPRTGPAATQVVFEVNDPPVGGGQTDDEQFTNGWVDLTSAAGTVIITARIVGYTTDESPIDDLDFKDEVLINIPACAGGLSGLACLGGVTSGTAVLSDDDLSVQATFTAKAWGCDDVYTGPVASLLPPDLSALQLRYHPAYIDPVQDTGASAVQGLTTFVRNWNESEDSGKALWDQCLIARNLPISTTDFWTVMMVAAWQAEEAEDADPNAEIGESPGVTKGINTHYENPITHNTPTTSSISPTPTYTGIAAIFRAVFGEAGFPPLEADTVAHEIGHTFGLDHPDGGLMCASGPCQTQPFTSTSLQKLRDYTSP